MDDQYVHALICMLVHNICMCALNTSCCCWAWTYNSISFSSSMALPPKTGSACCAFPLNSNLCWPYWSCCKENWFRVQSSFVSVGFKAFSSYKSHQWIQILRLLKAQRHPGLTLIYTHYVKMFSMPAMNSRSASSVQITNKLLYLNVYAEINVYWLGRTVNYTCCIWCKNTAYMHEYFSVLAVYIYCMGDFTLLLFHVSRSSI